MENENKDFGKLGLDKLAYSKDQIYKTTGGRPYVQPEEFGYLGGWLFETYRQGLANYRVSTNILEFVCYMPSFYSKVMFDYLGSGVGVRFPDHGEGSYHPTCMGIEILPGYEDFMVFAPDQESLTFGNRPLKESLILKIPILPRKSINEKSPE